MSDEEVLRRLDKIQATLQLAFAPQLADARAAIRADDVNEAILDLTEDWIGTSELQARVGKKTGKGARAVRDRFPALLAKGVLEARGSEARREFRRMGLV